MSWDECSEASRKLLQMIRACLSEREERILDGEDIGDVQAEMRKHISTLERTLSQMESELSLASNTPRSKLTRRRRELDNLRRQGNDLKTQYRATPQSSERDRLFQKGGSGAAGGRAGYMAPTMTAAGAAAGGGAGSADVEAGQPRRTNRELMQDVHRMEEQQDEILDEMAVGVGNLKRIGTHIGEEADLQLGLLDDFEKDVDKTKRNLKKRTKEADIVRKDNVCWMYCVICVLIIVLIALCVFFFA